VMRYGVQHTGTFQIAITSTSFLQLNTSTEIILEKLLLY